MEESFIRTAMLLGDDAIRELQKKKVLVLGIGGVGGYAVEALARAGIGALTLVDGDVLNPSNLNRQILATYKDLGRPKTEVAKERIEAINPHCHVECYPMFYDPDIQTPWNFEDFDYILDCIDFVKGKIELATIAYTKHIPIISCMGAGNKYDPTQFEVLDLYKTEMDPLARHLRRELKKRGVLKLKVVASKEPPMEKNPIYRDIQGPASLPYVPGVAGLLMAGEVLLNLTQHKSLSK